ncbi:MAG: pilus assembly protein PilM [Planctomycetaceae bacterium]|nr:pilus assembly protein PilM [Planctomycetaceae bacterium]
MAKSQTVWGIDVGNTSLKALRCTLAEEPGKVEALACDFIEHSKVLSQPGTDAVEVLAETLQTFLSRNTTKGDRIAISVSGQNTISRFLPLPPVNPKKIPDVIRYEAKQWLPFDINDVVFDFQPLGSPTQESDDDTIVEAMVGMFAIKRDVATKTLTPYLSQSVDIDSIQSSPIALYNFVAFDQLPPPPTEAPDDDTQPESLIALCIGTDATDVVITNGTTIWTRNIPLGGNSFTKALTRELQLTFSKAEYLKRNITASKDVEEQKRVITAMRPVFNDMVNEVNRSLEYYQTLNRKAKFNKIVAMGNASKLPGLRQFIAQNLGYEVVRLPRFNNLIGAEVTDTQLFKDNLFSFAVPYGLAVQQLGISSLKTNLIPREIVMDRIIREKKPWLLAAAAALLLGITIQFAGVSSARNSVFNEGYERAGNKAQSVQSNASNLKSQTSSAVSAFNSVDTLGRSLTSNVEGRVTWLEVLRAINAALPQAQPGARLTGVPVDQRDQVYITSIEAVSVDSLTEWFAPLKENNRYYPDDAELQAAATPDTSSGATAPTPSDGENTEGTPVVAQPPRPFTEAERFELVTGPTGTGPAMVVQVTGYHFRNPTNANEFAANGGQAYLRNTLLRNLKFGTVDLPPTLEERQAGISTKTVALNELGESEELGILSNLGISYPTLLYVRSPVETRIPNPDLFPLPPGVTVSSQGAGSGSSSMSSMGGGGTSQSNTPQGAFEQHARNRNMPAYITVRRFDFVIQFAWEVTPPSVRKQNAEQNAGTTDTSTEATTN